MNDVDVLVERISEECFAGFLPPFPDVIVQSVLESVPRIRAADERTTRYFAALLYNAVCARIDAQRVDGPAN